jgi:hypothetical protein
LVDELSNVDERHVPPSSLSRWRSAEMVRGGWARVTNKRFAARDE